MRPSGCSAPAAFPRHSSSLNTVLIKPIWKAGSHNYRGLPDLSGFGRNLLSPEFRTRLFCREVKIFREDFSCLTRGLLV